MSESRVQHNVWAIAVAAVASFVLAAGWYTMFLQPWLKGISRTMADLATTGVPEWVPYAVALVLAALMATGIDCVIQLTGPQRAGRGIKVAFLLWLGFVFTTLAIEYTYEVRPVLFAINAGYWLVSMAVMGAILGGWKKRAAKPTPISDRGQKVAQ